MVVWMPHFLIHSRTYKHTFMHASPTPMLRHVKLPILTNINKSIFLSDCLDRSEKWRTVATRTHSFEQFQAIVRMSASQPANGCISRNWANENINLITFAFLLRAIWMWSLEGTLYFLWIQFEPNELRWNLKRGDYFGFWGLTFELVFKLRSLFLESTFWVFFFKL